MLIRNRRGWEIPESRVTPESGAISRRAFTGAAAAAALAGIADPAQAQWRLFGGPSAPPPPPVALKPLNAARNPKYDGGRAMTAETDATTYNNYYEFGLSKSVDQAARALPVSPWTIRIDGMVRQPRTIGFEDLMKQVSLQERVYRHRCVERWAMTVPWTGFPMADLVKLAEPTSGATYVQMVTLEDKKVMPGVRGQPFWPWPYVEGLTMMEAMNELTFISVGIYGKTLPPQNGAPLRLTVPWKYGFKSVKSIVSITFTDKRPVSFWEGLQEEEYGFWANVNPKVPHPRWSQAEETLLGSEDVVPTQIWNGYGAFVADMYKDIKGERLFT